MTTFTETRNQTTQLSPGVPNIANQKDRIFRSSTVTVPSVLHVSGVVVVYNSVQKGRNQLKDWIWFSQAGLDSGGVQCLFLSLAGQPLHQMFFCIILAGLFGAHHAAQYCVYAMWLACVDSTRQHLHQCASLWFHTPRKQRLMFTKPQCKVDQTFLSCEVAGPRDYPFLDSKMATAHVN